MKRRCLASVPSLAAVSVCAVALLAAGCHQSRIETPEFAGTYAPADDRAAVIERYNRRCAALADFSARALCTLDWQEMDDAGEVRTRRESGDGGRLLFHAPRSTTLTIEKLGKWYLWAGSDAGRYWLFDRTGDGLLLRHGRHDGPGAAAGLGLPVRPADLPLLLGLQPLDPAEPWKLQAFTPRDETSPPGLVLSKPGLRLFLDRHTSAPRRVDLLDADGRPALSAELSIQRTPVVDPALPENERHFLPAKVRLYPAAQPGRAMRLELEIVRAEVGGTPAAFDFDKLVRSLKPDRVEDLDAGR